MRMKIFPGNNSLLDRCISREIFKDFISLPTLRTCCASLLEPPHPLLEPLSCQRGDSAIGVYENPTGSNGVQDEQNLLIKNHGGASSRQNGALFDRVVVQHQALSSSA